MQHLAANSKQEWDRIWSDPAEAEWRERVLTPVYDRIVELVPEGSRVVDLGGGVGTLARRLGGVVWDHSAIAVAKAPKGSRVVDLEAEAEAGLTGEFKLGTIVVATEVIEHLSDRARAAWMTQANIAGSMLCSVPNNRLGPDEEPQHTRKWTAKQFLDELRGHFGAGCRVEVLGPFLLGVCGELACKRFRLSVCTPARDEAHDLARTLASFRGVADQLVVGIDYRSADDTEAVAREYADEVFIIDDPRGPPDDEAPKVHFAHIRNRCIDRCTGDWIFMTEAHEHLLEGADALLRLDELPDAAKVCFVRRTGQGQQWGFPWLFRRDPRIRFSRATHNVLNWPPSYKVLKLGDVATEHKRHQSNAERRKVQRAAQNRRYLTEDWLRHGNQSSLMYLGSEWAETHPDKAIERLQEFLAVNRSNGPQRYHARLQCARLLARSERFDEARTVLVGAVADDWSRVDHWFYLGDLAAMREAYDEAIQFYEYSATRLGNPPFSAWWVDLGIYGYLTAQRLTECYAATGQLTRARHWAQQVVDLIGDSPTDARDEARRNLEKIDEAINADRT